MDFGDRSDNPFAMDLKTRPVESRRRFSRTAIFLLLVAGCLALVLFVGYQSRQWLVHHLTHDFDSLSGDQKRARLVQIADLGTLGIDPLVQTLTDSDLEVARTAYDLLRESQNNWTALSTGELEQNHRTLVRSLEAVALQLPDDRTGWGTTLLQQTILTTVDQRDEGAKTLYRDATHALDLLSLSDHSGPSILMDEPLAGATPRRLTVHAVPLPVRDAGAVGQWVDWPPAAGTDGGAGPAASSPPIGGNEDSPEESITELPSLYRSSAAKLQPVQPEDPVILRDVVQARAADLEAAASGQASLAAPAIADDSLSAIQSVTHLVDSPLQTFDDKSVMHWLASRHHALREKAEQELISRGYDARRISIAKQIASSDARTRLDLIDSIARSDSIDPRPWLLMLLEDDSREVKLRAISVLATMNDPSIDQRLRMRLVDEADVTVAHRIRRILDR